MKDQGTHAHDFASVTDFNNLYQSFTEARKGKRWKYSVCKYEANVLENLLFIQVMLQRHKYRLSPYNCFFVHEPKERLIMYNSFRDKIVQHLICPPSDSRSVISDRNVSGTTSCSPQKQRTVLASESRLPSRSTTRMLCIA